MIEIQTDQVTSYLTSLFDGLMPQAQRCFAVLQGSLLGKILIDDLAAPVWAAVWEQADGTLYLGGHMTAQIVDEVINVLRREAEVLVGLWVDDPRWAWLPPRANYVGFAIDFVDRAPSRDLAVLTRHLPEGCEVRRMDADLAVHSSGFQSWSAHFGGVEAYLRSGMAFCLLKDGEMMSEASADPPANGVMEIGTGTHKAHRQKGYATWICAYTIQACEHMGRVTHWNCARQNLASAALARKMGYRIEKEFRLWVWPKHADSI